MSSFLVGTYTRRGSQGIMKVDFDPDSRAASKSLFVKIDNPTYLCVHDDYVFSVGSVHEQAGIILIHQGKIRDMLLLESKVPCHISVNPILSHVYTSNYHEGQLVIAQYDEMMLKHIQTITFPQGSKAHYAAYESFDEILYVCDLGLDCVRGYRFNSLEYVLEFEIKFPTGSGPRHAQKHPTLPIMYVLSELSGQIFVCEMQDGTLKIRSAQPTYPPQFEKPWAAAIRVSQDGRHCYTSNRGHDSISHFLIDDMGNLHFQSRVPTYGKQPRDFNLIDNDRYCCVLNHDSDKGVIFLRGNNGVLEKCAEFQIEEGVCVCLT